MGRPCSLVVLRRQATMARPAAPRWDTRPTARHTAPLAQRRVGNRLRAANLRALGSRCPHLHAAALRGRFLLLLYHRRGNRSCAASIHPPSLEARACTAASRGAAIARVGNKHVNRVPSLLYVTRKYKLTQYKYSILDTLPNIPPLLKECVGFSCYLLVRCIGEIAVV